MHGVRSNSGQSTVELAIMLPLLLLVLIGIVDVALSINAYVTVTNATREAANYAITHPAAAATDVASAATTRVSPLNTANVTVNTTWYDTGSTVANAWPPTSGNPARSIAVRVEVSYPWSASTIFVGQLFSSRTFSSASTMAVTW